MKLRVNRKSEWFYLFAGIILVAGFWFWQSDLTSDPPMYFSGIGQSLSTDPYMYSHHARNKILFGEADPLNDQRWIVYKHSAVSFVSYIWLSLTDITLKEANTVGVLLSLTGLFLLLLGLVRHHSPWVVAAVALCYLINISLLIYGRLPYLENGLILFSGLTFLIWMQYGNRIGGAVLLGCVVALAAVTGKLFGLLLLPALVLTMVILGGENKGRRILYMTGAFLVISIALISLLYGTGLDNAVEFFTRQSIRNHGFPEGLTSPWAFVEHFTSFGLDSNLFYLNPDILLLLVTGGILLAYRMRRNRVGLRDLPPATLFSLAWIVVVWIGLMPLNYSPLRYSLFMIPPIIIFCFTMLDWMITSQRNALLGNGVAGIAVVSLLLWIVVLHFVMNVFFYNDFSAPRRLIVWGCLPVGVGLTLIGRYILQRKVRLLKRRLLGTVVIILVMASMVVNSARIRRKHFLDNHFSTIEANQDIAQIVGRDAVIAGPYALSLTFQTDNRSLIHFFDGSGRDVNLFRTYPITHLALDVSNWRRAVEVFPELADLTPIASYWIRDFQVQLFNVSKLFDNPVAGAYTESTYERAVTFVQNQQIDSAFSVLSAVPDIINTSKSAGILFSRMLRQQNQYEHVLQMLVALADRYPTDFSLQLECGHYLQQVALQRNDRLLLRRAQEYFEKAVDLNPYKADYANALYGQTLERWNHTGNGGR
ncbi:MAG: hypothetical protein JSU65_00475 [Candidatus Zixiibacteriota bacterium]|nr:MAG: hypothetical protein JSU65_00475 [candidate division Zixibacteria bacterium]